MPPPGPGLTLPRIALKTPGGIVPEACINCRFWMPERAQNTPPMEGQPAGVASICRRYPPTMQGIPMQAPAPRIVNGARPQPPQMMIQPMPFWGLTAGTDWCGEFSPRLAPPGA